MLGAVRFAGHKRTISVLLNDMPLKFCANLSFMFQETSCLLERYNLAKEAGFHGVECAFPYSFSTEDVVQAKKNANVEQILINIFPGDVSKNELGFAALPGREEEFKRSIALAIKYAEALNCSRIHIMSGCVKNATKENSETYEKNILYATSLLEKKNIIGLIEPINPYSVPTYYMNSYEKALELIKKVNSPNLRLMMDIFHLQHLKGNLTHSITDLLPFVGHIQIAQVPLRNEPDTQGEINYPYVLALLEEKGYNGWIGLEYKPLNKTEEGLKWISKFDYSL